MYMKCGLVIPQAKILGLCGIFLSIFQITSLPVSKVPKADLSERPQEASWAPAFSSGSINGRHCDEFLCSQPTVEWPQWWAKSPLLTSVLWALYKPSPITTELVIIMIMTNPIGQT